MLESRTSPTTLLPVLRALRKLGADMRDARRRRRIPVSILAERASISRTTLNRIEKGDTNASIGNYSTILFALGMLDRLTDIADARHDTVGLELEEEHLPQRVRLPRRQKPATPDKTGARWIERFAFTWTCTGARWRRKLAYLVRKSTAWRPPLSMKTSRLR